MRCAVIQRQSDSQALLAECRLALRALPQNAGKVIIQGTGRA